MLWSSNFFFQAFNFAGSSSNSCAGQCLLLGYPPVPISAASTPRLAYFSTNWSSVRSGNAGSKTPIGIFRRAPGEEMCVPSDWGAAADSARGAATAPARAPPVVARKFRRVGESGSEFFPMKFLDLESTTLEHYTHDIAGRMERAVETSAKAKTALSGGFSFVG